MEYVFGPVRSRRLGQSLGIDPIPFKTCNYSCVYCQLGRTSPRTIHRREFHPPEQIVAEVKDALAAHSSGDIDWITFVSSGEPTLHSGLGRMIRQVKALTDIPLAVITNGSLLYRRQVRQELLHADAVLPSLDAGSASLYHKINRPAKPFTFERLVSGLMAFRQTYKGRLWVEVMLIKGLNDTSEALADLAAVLSRVAPDEVHVAVPTRPPTEAWVEPADEEGLKRASAVLGGVARIVPLVEGSFDLAGYDNPVDAVISIITRHPMGEEELVCTLARWTPGQVAEALQELAASGRAQVVTRHGRRFWSYVGARYSEQSRCNRPRGGKAGSA